jgi:oligopeptidase A
MEHPFLDLDFHIRWSRLTPDRIEPDIAAGLARAQARLDALKALRGSQLTYANVLLGFENATRELSLAWGKVGHLDAVCNSAALREAHNKMLPQVTAFYTGIALDPDLWSVLKAYAETEEAKNLIGEQGRFLEETLADFREAGADLPADRKQRLRDVKDELAKLTQKFSENVLDATNAWELIVTDRARLGGLPEQALALAADSARKKQLGTAEQPAWRFTLHQPSMIPVLQYADDDALRKQTWEGSIEVGRAGRHDNRELIWKILALRDEMARLLGFAHFADFTTHRRMAKSGRSAWDFIGDLHTRTRPFFLREAAELEAFKAEATGAAPGRLTPWEMAYWSEKQRKQLYDFDKEALRPYLPMDGVLSGLYNLAQRLFGITLRERPTVCGPATGDQVEVWHPEVKFYEVHDGGRHIGSFYCDWYPRESKRGGAWMNFFHTGGPRPGGAFAPHLGLMCGNMSPPVGDTPALLSHDDVTTVFHEFGHLLHHLLCACEVESLSGTRVPWDFVELPSQILENWCWHKESLDLFARHHQTGEPLPADLLQKLIRSARYRAGSLMMGQLLYGRLDLDLHIHLDAVRGIDLDRHWRERLADYLAPSTGPSVSMAPRFTHLFGHSTGYAAGYYSYKWAEVLEADCFTRFEKEGILNGETGRDFRDAILARGNSEPPEELFRRFMGRDPDPEALLRREGLVSG